MFLSSSSPTFQMGHIFQTEVKRCASHRQRAGEKNGRWGQWESLGLAPCWRHISPRRHQLFDISSEYLLRPLGSCYRLNVSVTPKFICWKPSPPVWYVWRWGLLEVIRSWGWSPHDRISALIGRDKWELASSLSPSCWGYNEKMILSKTRKRASPDNRSAGTLILDFLASGILRSKCLLLSHPVYGTL